MKFLRAGKAKDIYLDDEGNIVFVFTDRVTAFDGQKSGEFPKKGEVCCRLSCFWFKRLEAAGVRTHFKRFAPPNCLVAERLEIIPVEVLCRNYLYGSLWRRYERGELRLDEQRRLRKGEPLKRPFVEFTTKFEEVDRPISEAEILERGWLADDELEFVKKTTLRVNDVMSEFLRERGIILADFKLEFGRSRGGEILLADEVGTPDVCRFWDAAAYERGEIVSLDKDVFREDKGDLSSVYLDVYRRICGSPLDA
ncbi:MAG: Phosphoribosylaminoimidazole-succinocarboxamide synthase [Candidatus Alkanophagales archaeon MCA70_species_1]|nr:Phosphoribosylaminoimidazole-succinocarboxamide synthase [Candidatus Alkanophaga volatiphilum]